MQLNEKSITRDTFEDVLQHLISDYSPNPTDCSECSECARSLVKDLEESRERIRLGVKELASADELVETRKVSIALPVGNSRYALRKFGEPLFIATLAVLIIEAVSVTLCQEICYENRI